MKEATVQKIREILPHNNADALEIAKVLGWQVVVKKGEFKAGDLCVYICIDSAVPETSTFEFLRNKHFRIKPIRLRGEESAGICFPLSILPNYLPANDEPYDVPRFGANIPIIEGTDVSDTLAITHYEKPIPAELAGQAKGMLPGFLIMTDEDNLRTYPDALPELWGRPYYITRKDDGCSGTFYLNGGEFGVCSRRIDLKESEGNGFWRMARKYDLANVLKKEFGTEDWAIQGEVCGPGIQDNHIGLTELELHIFNLFNISARSYASYDKLAEFCKKYNLVRVTDISESTSFGFNVEELVKLASEQKYPNGKPAEGVVVRPQEGFTSGVLKKWWSGKVLNPLFDEEKKKKK
jgi:RNA ligase (TIGR02306 family)